ncbi:hypothetical protein [Jeotgalibaca sp. PTS2502]|uniref:hypothetical protein n=1 Tax=Jeotgalibaca sp. PTS2502 TaxID=1903686 RepID=UPI001E5EF9D6|nr:hypothetical protein [Jeotgalibaca sp. PTS2502]
MIQGIEGVHYEVSSEGVYERLDDTLWQQEVQPFSSSRPSETVTVFKSSSELTNLANELISENADYAITNPAQSLDSETYTAEWSTLSEGIEDAFYKYMMGNIEMADFEAAIETFLNTGGQAVIDEFTASYAENN